MNRKSQYNAQLYGQETLSKSARTSVYAYGFSKLSFPPFTRSIDFLKQTLNTPLLNRYLQEK